MLSLYLSLIDSDDDKDKFEVVYYKYRKKMWYAANSILHDTHLSEDAVQNAFIKIARNIKKIDEPTSDNTRFYVLTAAEHAAIDMKRLNSYKIQAQSVNIDDFELPNESSLKSFEEQISDKAVFDEIIKTILELDSIYSDVLYLYYADEMKPSQIAKTLGLKTSTINKRINRGKQKLISLLYENEVVKDECK